MMSSTHPADMERVVSHHSKMSKKPSDFPSEEMNQVVIPSQHPPRAHYKGGLSVIVLFFLIQVRGVDYGHSRPYIALLLRTR